jgi:outer membrane receptor for ferrienterochelin and colicin
MGTHLAPAARVHPRSLPGVRRWWRPAGSALFLIAALASRAGAQTAGDGVPETNNDLAIFSDLPEVVSASHQATTLTMSSASMSVLTGDEIMAGGHTDLAEALQFVPGLDVERTDRTFYAVGIHGLFGTISDRTVTLVNGRDANDLMLGGSELSALPLFMADIDHVEVVRGPAGAAWGANALQGVINIITKEPEDMLGVFVTSGVTDFGDTLSQARWAEVDGRWSWSMSVGYENQVSSAKALDDSSLPGNDWLHAWMTDNQLVYHFDAATKLSAGLAYADVRGGAYELLDLPLDGESYEHTTRSFVRLDQHLDAHTGFQLEWYGNYVDEYHPGFEASRDSEDMVDGQFDLLVAHQHQLTIGGQAGYLTMDEEPANVPYQVIFLNAPNHEERYSGFLTDRWQAASALVVEGQYREDHYSDTGNDWSGRLSSLYNPDPQQVVRLSVAKAYRNPMTSIRDAAINIPLDGNPALRFAVIPGDDLRDEEVWSGEIGYSNQLSEELLVRWDAAYQRYSELIGYSLTPANPAAPPPFTTTVQPANIGGAKAYTSDLEATWSVRSGLRLDAWYSFDEFETEQIDQQIRAFKPPRHSAGASTRLPLPEQFALTVNYRYSDATIDPGAASGYHVAAYQHVDITLAWRFDRGRGELMAGVLDAFESRQAAVQNSGSFVAYQTPGRTFMVRGEWGF